MLIELNSIEDLEKLNFIWPKVTALVLTYNQELFISQTISSILSQNVDNDFLLLIHDDASTDKTIEKVKQEIINSPIQVILISQLRNQYSQKISITAKLITAIRSEYIAMCEGDDFWTDNSKLATQMHFLDENQDCGLVHTSIEVSTSELNSHSVDLKSIQELNTANMERAAIRPGVELAFGNFIFTPTVMFRRKNVRPEVLNMMDGLSPTDWILWSLICEDSNIGYLKISTAVYRLHNNNTWAGSSSATRLLSLVNAYWFLAGILSNNVKFMFQIGLVQMLTAKSIQILESDKASQMDETQIHVLNWFEHVRFSEAELIKHSHPLEEIKNLELQLQEIMNSHSWKLTSPIRKMTRIARKFAKFKKI